MNQWNFNSITIATIAVITTFSVQLNSISDINCKSKSACEKHFSKQLE